MEGLRYVGWNGGPLPPIARLSVTVTPPSSIGTGLLPVVIKPIWYVGFSGGLISPFLGATSAGGGGGDSTIARKIASYGLYAS